MNLNILIMKTLNFEEIKTVVEQLRQQKKKIVFTNGCFDILHPGHLFSLIKAKLEGDVLIVGINSDSSVKTLKGASRPIFSEKERSELLSALFFVDYVVIFSEETPIELIKLVQPDVLVKGGDYKEEDVVGREIVEARGGKLVMIPPVGGYSTSKIIERIKNV